MAAFDVYAVIHKEGNGWVAWCPELDVASQGDTIPHAWANLREAVELFVDTAGKEEVLGCLHPETYISRLDVEIRPRFRH